ncbi:MAG: hypothetical protein ACQEQU_00260 [Spirochaetota bacterium]
MSSTRVVIIGSTRKHMGKTTLVCRSLELLSGDVTKTAVKVTPLEDDHTAEKLLKTLQEGTFEVLVQQPDFMLLRITKTSGAKPLSGTDTDRYLAAGATAAYWLLTQRRALVPAWKETCLHLRTGVVFVESTSLGLVLEKPFLVISDEAKRSSEKELAREAVLRADWVLDPLSALYGSWYLSFHQGYVSLIQCSPPE